MSPTLGKRIDALEAARTAAPVRLTPEETAEAACQYEAYLPEPMDPDPRATAYWATVTPHRIATDYDAMLKGAQAPWE